MPPTWAEGVPLRRILGVNQDAVIVDDVGQFVVADGLCDRQQVARRAIGRGGRVAARRMAGGIEDIAAGQIERHRKAERSALLDLGDAFEHLLRRQIS